MLKLFVILVSLFVIALVINVLIYKRIVSIAIKKHLKTFFDKHGWKVLRYKYPGFLNTGQFNSKPITIEPYLNGIIVYTYARVDYLKDGINLNTTIRIKTIFGIITCIEVFNFGIVYKRPKA